MSGKLKEWICFLSCFFDLNTPKKANGKQNIRISEIQTITLAVLGWLLEEIKCYYCLETVLLKWENLLSQQLKLCNQGNRNKKIGQGSFDCCHQYYFCARNHYHPQHWESFHEAPPLPPTAVHTCVLGMPWLMRYTNPIVENALCISIAAWFSADFEPDCIPTRSTNGIRSEKKN